MANKTKQKNDRFAKVHTINGKIIMKETCSLKMIILIGSSDSSS